MEVTYQIDGTNIKTAYKVFVSRSSGLLDLPERKESVQTDWPDQNGIDIDLSDPVYKSRQITLECFTYGATPMEIMDQVRQITEALSTPGLKQLKIQAGNGIPLLYNVCLNGPIEVEKRWKTGQISAEFNLSLLETEPIKAYGLIKVRTSPGGGESALSVQLDIAENTGTSACKVYWDDGTIEFHDLATGSHLTHTYDNPGDYYVMITGKVSDMVVHNHVALTPFQIWPINEFE